MNGIVSDFTIPDYESEVDDEIASVGMPTLEDLGSEDESSTNPRRGHVRRQEETIEAAVLDKDEADCTKTPVAISRAVADREVGAVGFELWTPRPEDWKSPISDGQGHHSRLRRR